MARLSKEEEKQRHVKELNNMRVKKFYENHPHKHFDVRFEEEIYNKIDARLKKDGITKKDFILRSFENYIKNNGF